MKLILDLGLLLVTLTMMFAVGIALGSCVFRDVWKRRGALLGWLAANILLPPAVALGVVSATRMPVETAGGLLLIAACPIGDIANLYVLRARGNLPFSVSLNAASCLLFPLTMPLTFAAYRLLGNPHDLFTTPKVFEAARLFVCFSAPLLAGWWLRRRRPDWAAAVSRPLHLATTVGILALLVLIVGIQLPVIQAAGLHAAAGSLAFLVVGTALALGLAPLMKSPRPEWIAGLCCLPVRNVGIAALAAVTLGGHLGFAGHAAIYFVVEVVFFLTLSSLLGRRS